MFDLNIIRREAERVVARRAVGVRVGVISSYDPATHAVKLTMQPEGIQTGWVSIATDGIGNGFGIYSGPTLGDSVIVAYHEGDKKTPIVIGRLPTNEETPIPTQSGEIIAQSAFDSFIKLLKDGSVTLEDQGGGQIKFDGEGNITVTGAQGQTIDISPQGGIVATDKSGAKISADGSGNVLLQGKAGQQLVIDVNGSIILQGKNGSTVTLAGSGTTTMSGPGGQAITLDTAGNIILTPGNGAKLMLGAASASIPIKLSNNA